MMDCEASALYHMRWKLTVENQLKNKQTNPKEKVLQTRISCPRDHRREMAIFGWSNAELDLGGGNILIVGREFRERSLTLELHGPSISRQNSTLLYSMGIFQDKIYCWWREGISGKFPSYCTEGDVF